MSQPFEQPGATAATGEPVYPATPVEPAGGHDEYSTKDVAKDRAAGVAGDAKQGAGQVADTAKQNAGQVADTAKQGAGQVAGTAKAEARQVVDEAGQHASALFTQARDELTTQVDSQQSRLAETLKTLGADLSSMASGEKPSQGLATDLASQASGRLENASQWLEQRGPAEVLDEVKRFARRRPGAFLAAAALTGLVAGRLTRSLTDDARSDDEPQYSGYGSAGYQRGDTPTTAPVGGVDTGYTQPAYNQPGYTQPAYAGEEGTVNTTGVDSPLRTTNDPQYGGAGDFPGTAGNEGGR